MIKVLEFYRTMLRKCHGLVCWIKENNQSDKPFVFFQSMSSISFEKNGQRKQHVLLIRRQKNKDISHWYAWTGLNLAFILWDIYKIKWVTLEFTHRSNSLVKLTDLNLVFASPVAKFDSPPCYTWIQTCRWTDGLTMLTWIFVNSHGLNLKKDSVIVIWREEGLIKFCYAIMQKQKC